MEMMLEVVDMEVDKVTPEVAELVDENGWTLMEMVQSEENWRKWINVDRNG